MLYIIDIAVGDFGVSAAILLRGANSGQSPKKCCDLACIVEQPPPLKIFKDLAMELEVRFSQLHLPTHSFIYHQFGKRPRKEKNISTWYYDGKESTNQGRHFQDFYKFSWSYVDPQSQYASPHENFINGITKPKMVYLLQ